MKSLTLAVLLAAAPAAHATKYVPAPEGLVKFYAVALGSLALAELAPCADWHKDFVFKLEPSRGRLHVGCADLRSAIVTIDLSVLRARRGLSARLTREGDGVYEVRLIQPDGREVVLGPADVDTARASIRAAAAAERRARALNRATESGTSSREPAPWFHVPP